jgi:hypothetical protein
LSLVTLTSSTVMAASHAERRNCHKNREYWNLITIHNIAPYDLIYRFANSKSAGNEYGIEQSSTDLYHSGVGDARVTIVLSGCTERNLNGGCTTYTQHALPGIYNAEQISTINFKSVFDVEITCLDGSSTSCLAK